MCMPIIEGCGLSEVHGRSRPFGLVTMSCNKPFYLSLVSLCWKFCKISHNIWTFSVSWGCKCGLRVRAWASEFYGGYIINMGMAGKISIVFCVYFYLKVMEKNKRIHELKDYTDFTIYITCIDKEWLRDMKSPHTHAQGRGVTGVFNIGSWHFEKFWSKIVHCFGSLTM